MKYGKAQAREAGLAVKDDKESLVWVYYLVAERSKMRPRGRDVAR